MANQISFRRGPIVITEVWPNCGMQQMVGDIVHYWYSDSPEERACNEQITEFTLEVDLTRPLDSLLAAMTRNTRQQIHHAAREGLQVHLWQSPEDRVIKSFLEFYDQFSQNQNMSGVAVARLRALLGQGMLALSCATSSGEPLVWHCYQCTGDRVRGWLSVSIFESAPEEERKRAGRANRYLTFKDMEAFKSDYKIYDFGGWYPGKDNQKLLGINRFKEEFGGRVVRHVSCDVGRTMTGKCWLKLRRLRRLLRASFSCAHI